MSMNAFLAEFYNTNGEATEKTAGEAINEEQIAMFAKVASENGIDVSKLSDEKLEELFHATFAEKTAGEMPPQFAKKEEKGDEKKDDKKDEEAEKKAAAEKADLEKKAEEERLQKQAEEADYMGRIMAHAYVNEMRKIAADVAAKEQEPVKTASIRERLLAKLAADEKKDEPKKDDKGEEKKDDKPMPPWMKDKEASALNEKAVEFALDIVQDFNKQAAAAGQQGVDVKEAAERLAAVYTLNSTAGVSEKTASVEDLASAVGIRALEFLELAGYPVNYPQ